MENREILWELNSRALAENLSDLKYYKQKRVKVDLGGITKEQVSPAQFVPKMFSIKKNEKGMDELIVASPYMEILLKGITEKNFYIKIKNFSQVFKTNEEGGFIITQYKVNKKPEEIVPKKSTFKIITEVKGVTHWNTVETFEIRVIDEVKNLTIDADNLKQWKVNLQDYTDCEKLWKNSYGVYFAPEKRTRFLNKHYTLEKVNDSENPNLSHIKIVLANQEAYQKNMDQLNYQNRQSLVFTGFLPKKITGSRLLDMISLYIDIYGKDSSVFGQVNEIMSMDGKITNILEGYNFSFKNPFEAWQTLFGLGLPMQNSKYVDTGNNLEELIFEHTKKTLEPSLKNKFKDFEFKHIIAEKVNFDYFDKPESNFRVKDGTTGEKFKQKLENLIATIGGVPDGLLMTTKLDNGKEIKKNFVLEFKTSGGWDKNGIQKEKFIKQQNELKKTNKNTISTLEWNAGYLLQAILYSYLAGVDSFVIDTFYLKEHEYNFESDIVEELRYQLENNWIPSKEGKESLKDRFTTVSFKIWTTQYSDQNKPTRTNAILGKIAETLIKNIEVLSNDLKQGKLWTSPAYTFDRSKNIETLTGWAKIKEEKERMKLAWLTVTDLESLEEFYLKYDKVLI